MRCDGKEADGDCRDATPSQKAACNTQECGKVSLSLSIPTPPYSSYPFLSFLFPFLLCSHLNNSIGVALCCFCGRAHHSHTFGAKIFY